MKHGRNFWAQLILPQCIPAVMPKLLQSAARSSAGLPAGAMLQSQGPLHGLGCDCLDISPNLQLAATGGADKLVKLHLLLVGTAAFLK